MDSQNQHGSSSVVSTDGGSMELPSLIAHLGAMAVKGFLPAKTPLRILPAPFLGISAACDSLPLHYHGTEKDVRPWLSAQFDDGPPAWRDAWQKFDRHTIECLMAQVSLLCHAFRWQSAPTTAANYELQEIVLPVYLDELWGALAAHLKIPKVGIFYTMVCGNWRLGNRSDGEAYDTEDIHDQNFELNYSWLQGSHERELRAFILAALGIESRGAALCKELKTIYEGIAGHESRLVAAGLENLAEELSRLSTHFNSYIRNGHMSASSFQTLLQPTMIWLLDHGDGPLEGASGPQSCVMQLLDSALGVPRGGDIGETLLAARRYMLPEHRELLASLDSNSQVLRDFVAQSENESLVGLYDECLCRLARWRKSHKSRGAMFIQPEAVEGGAYASTGMVVGLGVDRVAVFEDAMTTHMNNTDKQKLSRTGEKPNVGCPFAPQRTGAASKGEG